MMVCLVVLIQEMKMLQRRCPSRCQRRCRPRAYYCLCCSPRCYSCSCHADGAAHYIAAHATHAAITPQVAAPVAAPIAAPAGYTGGNGGGMSKVSKVVESAVVVVVVER